MIAALAPEDLRVSPSPLAGDYSRFAVGERLLLSGHSHQAWPDVALEGQVEAFEDAAREVDDKWARAFAKADELRTAVGALLGDAGADVALGQNTHELVVRFLSALDLRARPRLVTTDGEFHTLRRQLARLGEVGLDVVRLEASPPDTLAERLAAAVDDRTAAVLVSAVLYETARVVPGLGALAEACAARGAELLVDVYHAVGPRRVSLVELGLTGAWITGGGYKYLQLGEGNCYLRLPPQAAEMRPVLTGWFAEFDALAAQPGTGPVKYGRGASRFAGATYDPTSHYRAVRVRAFFAERGLTPDVLEESYRHQVALLAREVDALGLPDAVLTRDRDAPPDAVAGFLALESPHAGELQRALAQAGVSSDSRGRFLRLGPAPYLSDDQLREDRVVVAGGDGSIAPVAAAAGAAGIPLAVVPAGTANDFARRMELPEGLTAACRLAVHGTRLRSLELGWMNDRHPFVNVASAGLPAPAAERARSWKDRLGPLAYAAGAVSAGMSATPLTCLVECDGRELLAGEAWQVTVAASGAFGAGATVQEADPGDGALEVVAIEAGPRLGLVTLAYRLRSGDLTRHPRAYHMHCSHAEVQVPDGTRFNLDGELVTAGEARFQAVRGAFRLVVG